MGWVSEVKENERTVREAEARKNDWRPEAGGGEICEVGWTFGRIRRDGERYRRPVTDRGWLSMRRDRTRGERA